MVWDFVESVPIGDESANYGAAVDWICKVIEALSISVPQTAQVQQEDARDLPLPDLSLEPRCVMKFHSETQRSSPTR
jgi:hypothetical protein